MQMVWKYTLLGLLCGVFSGTFGVGSGIILIPALVLLFGIQQKSAQGICLAVMAPMALAGAIRYAWMPQIPVDPVVVGILAVFGIAGSLIGSELAAKLPAAALRKMFACVMVVAAARMFLK